MGLPPKIRPPPKIDYLRLKAIRIQDTREELWVLLQLPKHKASLYHFAIEISICKGSPPPHPNPRPGCLTYQEEEN